MLFTQYQSLSEMIISHLTYHPGSSLLDLQKAITPFLKQKISRQGWYKALRILLNAEVIVKNDKRYNLNIAWANHLVRLSFFIKANYLSGNSNYGINIPTKEGQKAKYKFPDLLTMDSFWSHVLVTIASKHPKTSFYAYNPHFWYFAAHQFEINRYFESMGQFGTSNFTLVGAKTDLDMWSGKLHPKDLSHYYCSPNPIAKDAREYILVINDYYMIAKIPKLMAERIDKLFRQTKLDINAPAPPQSVIDFFTQKSGCVLSIEKNKQKAQKFQRKVARYF